MSEAAQTLEPTKRSRKGEAKVRWTLAEDDIIRTHYTKLGPKRVAAMLPGRSDVAVRSRGRHIRISPEVERGRSRTISLHAAPIEEMVMAGVPTKVIAETLQLNYGPLHNYIYLRGLRAERGLLEADLAREIAEKHRETECA